MTDVSVKCKCGNEDTLFALADLITWLRVHAKECGEQMKVNGELGPFDGKGKEK